MECVKDVRMLTHLEMDKQMMMSKGEKCRQREVTVFSSTIPVCLLSMTECACFPECVCVLVLFLSQNIL